jgi:GntR family transcriptional regulator, transcriptional repressor for pyruvate dehydrogenase complex
MRRALPTRPVIVARRPARGLTQEVVDAIADRIRDGRTEPGTKLPTEAEIMAEHRVSRTVVREALSRLQASGQVRTRHGIGTFVVGPGDTAPFRVSRDMMATLQDVVAMLELRVGVETESAALAAARRSDDNLRVMRAALDAFDAAVAAGQDAAGADFGFHLEIARATGNERFVELMTTLGVTMIPRVRLGDGQAAPAVPGLAPLQREYLRRVNAEHEWIYDAIVARDAETARAAMRTHLARSRERRRQGEIAAGRRRRA